MLDCNLYGKGYHIIIRGPLRCGKTTAAKALTERLGAEYLFTDEELLTRMMKNVMLIVKTQPRKGVVMKIRSLIFCVMIFITSCAPATMPYKMQCPATEPAPVEQVQAVRRVCTARQWYMGNYGTPDGWRVGFRQCKDDERDYGDFIGFGYKEMVVVSDEGFGLPDNCLPNAWYSVPCQGEDGRVFGFRQCMADGKKYNRIVLCGKISKE